MNQHELDILNDPDDGFTEVCDSCFKILINWDSVGNSAFVSFDNRILCKRCYELVKCDG